MQTRQNKRTVIISSAVAIAATAFIGLGSIQNASAMRPADGGSSHKKGTTTSIKTTTTKYKKCIKGRCI